MSLLIQKIWPHFLSAMQLQIFLFIRPSGNPIDAKGFEKMISVDIVQQKAEITKIHRFEFLSNDIVMCIFTLGSKFTYKEVPNDDLPTVTSIFKKVNNV